MDWMVLDHSYRHGLPFIIKILKIFGPQNGLRLGGGEGGVFLFHFSYNKKGGLIKIIIKRFCFLTMIRWYHFYQKND